MTQSANPFRSLPAALEADMAKLGLVQRLLLACFAPMITAMFERLFARLADLFAQWQAGTLAPPAVALAPRPAARAPASRPTLGVRPASRPHQPARTRAVQAPCALALSAPVRTWSTPKSHPHARGLTSITPAFFKNSPLTAPPSHALIVPIS